MLTGKHPTSPVPALAPFENPTHAFSRVSFRSVSEGLPRLLPALRRPPQLHGAWVLVLPLASWSHGSLWKLTAQASQHSAFSGTLTPS